MSEPPLKRQAVAGLGTDSMDTTPASEAFLPLPTKAEISEKASDLRRLRSRVNSSTGETKEKLKETIAKEEETYKLMKLGPNRASQIKGAITTALKKIKTRQASTAPSVDGPEDVENAQLEKEVEALKAEYERTFGVSYSTVRSNKRRSLKNSTEPIDPLTPPPPPEAFADYVGGVDLSEGFRFELVHQSKKSGARVGRIHTAHGIINTPAFVPVGTNAALKAVSAEIAKDAKTQLMFVNTYHMLVHPGADVVEKAGGVHKFMNRDDPIITDSGGFQVFSLASTSGEDGPELKKKSKRNENGGGTLVKVSEEGTLFRSYHNGKLIELTPESSVAAQKQLGSDIIIPLDELPPYHVSEQRLKESVFLSHRWEARSLLAHLKNPNAAAGHRQAMYAVIHGGTNQELRGLSVDYLSSLPFDGYAIGGSLGKDREEMLELLRWLLPRLPKDKPNHLLGIADISSVQAVVPLGVDTMDACHPTRIARHGTLLSKQGDVKINSGIYLEDFGPIDPEVETIPYSRSYVHHLFKQNEPLAMSLASEHNLRWMNALMVDVRAKIMRDEI